MNLKLFLHEALMILNKVHLILSTILFIGYVSYSQPKSDSSIHNVYDDLVSLENTGLYNGTEFKDQFVNTDGSYRYFNLFNFTEGSIVYNNQFYSNVLLKYDLVEDNIITRSDDNLSLFKVRLIAEKISSFSIYNHKFIRLTDTELNLNDNGFFEIIYLGNKLNCYIKHQKKTKERAINKRMQYRFLDDNYYLLLFGETYHIIHSIKDLIKVIPERDQQIRNFYRSYKPLYELNTDGFMKQLVKYLDEGLEKSNQ